MQRICLLLATLFSSLLSAQATLLIEDETFKGVKLVVDGYLQNTRPTNKLAIKNFPIEKVDIQILLGSEEVISRKINLPDKGIHRYIIMRNFAGTLQLRYRGKEASVPPAYTQENYNQLLAYASEPPAAAPPVPERVEVPDEEEIKEEIALETPASSPEPDTNPKPEAAESNANDRLSIHQEEAVPAKPEVNRAKADKPRITLAKDTNALVQMNETFTIEEPAATAEETKSKEDNATKTQNEGGFDTYFALLKAEDFEFDKLRVAKDKLAKTALTPEQVVKILREFRYDQTRFQFLEEAAKHNPSLRHSVDLFKPEFEYILSRGKVTDILQGNE